MIKWISNYIHCLSQDAIRHTWPFFNGDTVETQLIRCSGASKTNLEDTCIGKIYRFIMNSLCVKLFIGIIKLHLQFISCLHTAMTLSLHLFRVRQKVTYFTKSIWWVLTLGARRLIISIRNIWLWRHFHCRNFCATYSASPPQHYMPGRSCERNPHILCLSGLGYLTYSSNLSWEYLRRQLNFSVITNSHSQAIIQLPKTPATQLNKLNKTNQRMCMWMCI